MEFDSPKTAALQRRCDKANSYGAESKCFILLAFSTKWYHQML